MNISLTQEILNKMIPENGYWEYQTVTNTKLIFLKTKRNTILMFYEYYNWKNTKVIELDFIIYNPDGISISVEKCIKNKKRWIDRYFSDYRMEQVL